MINSAWELQTGDLEKAVPSFDEWGQECLAGIENNAVFRLMLFQHRREKPDVNSWSMRPGAILRFYGSIIATGILIAGVILQFAGNQNPLLAIICILVWFFAIGLIIFVFHRKYGPNSKQNIFEDYSFGNLSNSLMKDLWLSRADAHDFVNAYWAYERLKYKYEFIIPLLFKLLLYAIAIASHWLADWTIYPLLAPCSMMTILLASERFQRNFWIVGVYNMVNRFHEKIGYANSKNERISGFMGQLVFIHLLYALGLVFMVGFAFYWLKFNSLFCKILLVLITYLVSRMVSKKLVDAEVRCFPIYYRQAVKLMEKALDALQRYDLDTPSCYSYLIHVQSQ